MIRAYRTPDKSLLVKILELNVPRYFDPKEVAGFERYLEVHGNTYFTIEYEGSIVGGVGYLIDTENRTGQITWIFFDPDHRGHGLGKKAVNHCHELLTSDKSVDKLIVTTSQLAYKFFEKFGYTMVTTEKDYWGEGLDLYEMELNNCF